MNYNLSVYKETELEAWINNSYRKAGLRSAADMDIERIAAIWDTEITKYPGPSFAEWEEDGYRFIFLDDKLDNKTKRAIFFHELSHPIQHCGKQEQLSDSFIALQEMQADQFQLYAAIPIFMLEEFKAIQGHDNYIKVLSDSFALPEQLVVRRMQQIVRRILQAEIGEAYLKFQYQRTFTSIESAPILLEPHQITLVCNNLGDPYFLYAYIDKVDWGKPLQIRLESVYKRETDFTFVQDAEAISVPLAALQAAQDTSSVTILLPNLVSIIGLERMGTRDISFLRISIADLEVVFQRRIRFEYEW
ncbi:ImmA/IrrE family metallo-endopeptidase [Paenibacillus aurantiacus]|uniref:ImmA/IrrE family metallo-endopeptidase n=1 Tax=Paenibacillus aurantiacus TaxID=1936118 RepID=A0ABV5KP13_9BACL